MCWLKRIWSVWSISLCGWWLGWFISCCLPPTSRPIPSSGCFGWWVQQIVGRKSKSASCIVVYRAAIQNCFDNYQIHFVNFVHLSFYQKQSKLKLRNRSSYLFRLSCLSWMTHHDNRKRGQNHERQNKSDQQMLTALAVPTFAGNVGRINKNVLIIHLSVFECWLWKQNLLQRR